MLYTEIFTKYKKHHNTFIETSTHHGGSVDRALKIGFIKIISIEPYIEDYNYCTNKYKNITNVTLVNDYSEHSLKNILLNINEPVLFYLDDHRNAWFAGGTHPIKKEIEIIAEHHIKTHTIIIDDYEHIPNINSGEYAGKNINVCSIIRDIIGINTEYKFELIPQKNGILIASV